ERGRDAGFECIISLTGIGAINLTRQCRPTAVTIDIGLRDVSGWKVLESLRHDPATLDIPVHLVTVFEDAQETGRQRGATTSLTKPASKEALVELFGRIRQLIDQGQRRVLVVEDEQIQRPAIAQEMSGD